MPEKIGIVASGGGNLCSATAGAYFALFLHGICDPHVIVTFSGGTQPSFCYLARRFQDTFAWPRRFDDAAYMNRFRYSRILDIDYLVDVILEPQYADLYRDVAHSPTKLFVAATRRRDGSLRWLTNRDMHHGGKVKKATCAIPGVYGREIAIDDEWLVDGGISVTLQQCVEKAFVEGADRVIVIDTQSGPFSWVQRMGLRALSWRQGPEIRAVVSNYLKRPDPPVETREHVHVCRPMGLPNKDLLDVTEAHTQRAMEIGFDTMTRVLETFAPA